MGLSVTKAVKETLMRRKDLEYPEPKMCSLSPKKGGLERSRMTHLRFKYKSWSSSRTLFFYKNSTCLCHLYASFRNQYSSPVLGS